MAGRSQASNLSGMLGSIGDTLGKMGETGNQYVETLRNQFRPDLDMNDPKSMEAYAQWLMNNGQQDEGRKMMAQAAEVQRGNRSREGQAAIMGLVARLKPGMDEGERQKIMTAVGRIAQNTGIEPLEIQQLLEAQNIQRRETSATERNTDSVIEDRRVGRDLEQQRIDDDFNIAMTNYSLGKDRLAETIRSNLAQEGLTSRGLDQDQSQFNASLEQRKNEFNLNYTLETDRFAETQRMNTHSRNVDNTKLKQNWASLDLDERRVVVAEQLKDNEISFTEFKQLVMGDENDRANQLQPYEIEAKKAGIQVALANAGYTEAQTERVLYDLGFEKSVRSDRQAIVENQAELGAANVGLTEARTANVRADTARTKKDIDRIVADTKSIRARTDYQETATEALVAEMRLNEEKFQFAQRTQLWQEGIDEATLKLKENAQRSDIAVNSAQIDNLNSLIESRTFRDNMLAAETMGKGVSQAYQAAYALQFDPLNQSAVDNARLSFYNQYGAGALLDFDAALQEKVKLKQLQVTVQGLQRGLEDKKPPTRASLKAAGFSDDAIDTVINLPASQRNQAILNEATRLLSPERGGSVTQAHLDVVKDRAEEMFYATFGEDWTFIVPTFNGVWDQEVIDKVQWALAEANAAGRSPLDAVMAGANAMMPYLEQTGGGAVQGLDSLINSMTGN